MVTGVAMATKVKVIVKLAPPSGTAGTKKAWLNLTTWMAGYDLFAATFAA